MWPPVDFLRTFASVSRLHIVVIAGLGTLTFGWLFTGEHHFSLMGVAAFDWFIVNLTNRVVDVKEDAANRITGVGFVRRYRKALVGLSFLALFLSFGVVHSIDPRLTLVRVPYHLLGLFYNFELLPGRARLKQIYIVKNVASALGFMLTCFAYPLAHASWGFFGLPYDMDWMSVSITAVFFFLFELSYEVIYDLRDVEGDKAAGVESFPAVLGPDIAVTIIDQLLLFSGLALVVGYAMHFLPWRVFVMIAAPALQFVLYKRALKRGLRAGDCIALTWIGAGLLAVYHVWIYLRLPGVLA